MGADSKFVFSFIQHALAGGGAKRESLISWCLIGNAPSFPRLFLPLTC